MIVGTTSRDFELIEKCPHHSHISPLCNQQLFSNRTFCALSVIYRKSIVCYFIQVNGIPLPRKSSWVASPCLNRSYHPRACIHPFVQIYHIERSAGPDQGQCRDWICIEYRKVTIGF